MGGGDGGEGQGRGVMLPFGRGQGQGEREEWGGVCGTVKLLFGRGQGAVRGKIGGEGEEEGEEEGRVRFGTFSRVMLPGRQQSNWTSASSEFVTSSPLTSTMMSFFLNPQAAAGEPGTTRTTSAPCTSGNRCALGSSL